MPTYNINGLTVQAASPLADDEIDEIAAQHAPAAPDAAPQASIAGAAAQGLDSGLNTIAQGLITPAQMATRALAKAFPGHFDTSDIPAEHAAFAAAQAKDAQGVPTLSTISSPRDAAAFAANRLAGAAPVVAGALSTGGAAVGTGAGLGALTGAGDTYAATDDPTATGVAAGLGAAVGAADVPFLKGGTGGVIKGAARGAAANAAIGAVSPLAQTIPAAIASGNPADAIPSPEQVADSAVSGALVGGVAGGVMHAGAGGEQPSPSDLVDQANRTALAERIHDEAMSQANGDARGAKKLLSDVDSAGTTANVLNNVHNSLAEEIKANAALLNSQLDPQQAADQTDFANRIQAAATIRDARNKVKSTASPDDIANLRNLVGGTAEGQQLINAVGQSNELTGLFNGGLKGGLSLYTDKLNPLAGLGGHGFAENIAHGGGRAIGLGIMAHAEPSMLLGGAATFAGARAIDAVTGKRYPVANFVKDNYGVQSQPSPSAFPSVFDQRAQASSDAQAAQQAQADNDARLAQRETQLRNQRRTDNVAGLGGFDRSIYDQTGLLPHQTMPGVVSLARQGRITPEEAQAFFKAPRALMAGNAGNHVIDMLDDMARKGQLTRDPEWQPQQASSSSQPPQSAYNAQAEGNQGRVTAALARVAAHPELDVNDKTAIGSAISRIGKTNNKADAGSIAKDLYDNLSSFPARSVARAEVEPLISQIRHATRETAAKAQPLQTEAVTRDSRGRPTQRKPLNFDNTDKLTDAFSAAVPRGDAADGANPVSRLRAQLYKTRAGIDKPAYEGAAEPSQDYLKSVADFHETAVHDPSNPAVKASYDALSRETLAQYKSLGNLKVETWRGQGEPYRGSADMMKDVQQNGHLWFLPTDAAFGAGDSVSHPMLKATGMKTVDGHPLLVNDIFRIVHDFYGHTQSGFQFGPKGEYNAFREHAQMYSDKALPALAAETLAQNAWVNAGPHMRRADGSLPQKGAPDFIAQAQRRFSDQKAYAFPHDLINADPLRQQAQSMLRQKVSEIDGQENNFFQRIAQGADVAAKFNSKSNYDRVAGFKALAPYLTPEERSGLALQTARKFVDVFKTLPSAEEMASVAHAGRAKRGWYANSAKAIQGIFGADDAPRFSALLASLSPQCSVEMNLMNGLNVWAGWVEAGRPRDEASIRRILGENVIGDKGEDSVLEAWARNSLRTLSSEDPNVDISGPKVSSFMKNLLGEVQEVTNDTWMGNYAGVDPAETFKAARPKAMSDSFGTFGVKNGGYLAMSALARKAAQIATQRTGSPWTPAEVQETVWSWAKALAEKTSTDTEGRSAGDIVKQGSLTHGEINSTPDFEKLFVNETYRRILEGAGYGDQLAALAQSVSGRAPGGVGPDAGASTSSAEGAGVSEGAFQQHLSTAAARLDQLIGRSQYKSSTKGALSGRRTITGSADVAAGEQVVSTHPSFKDALMEAERLGGIKQRYVVRPSKEAGAAVVKLPPKVGPVERPSAPIPPFHIAMDPEGHQVTARFIAGMAKPDGTMKGLSEPEVRTVAKTIARLIEDVHPSDIDGNHGIYDPGNNSIRVAKGLTPDEHERVLGHETGHAIENLTNVARTLEGAKASSPQKALEIVKELQDVSRLERPHLWTDDATLEKNYSRSASSMHEYRGRLGELLADGFRHYMTKPASMKKTAPNAAKFMRDLVNPTKIGKVIAFTSLAGLTLPSILSGALASLYRGDDKDQ